MSQPDFEIHVASTSVGQEIRLTRHARFNHRLVEEINTVLADTGVRLVQSCDRRDWYLIGDDGARSPVTDLNTETANVLVLVRPPQERRPAA